VQGITGKKVYKADYLIKKIEKSRKIFKEDEGTVANQDLRLTLYKFTDEITRGDGLREKVEELLLAEN